MTPSPAPDPAPTEAPEAGSRLDRLAGDVVAGACDWAELVAELHPLILAMCRRRPWTRAFDDVRDLHRDVAVRVLDRIRADDCAALRRFLDNRERYPDASLERWLRVVVSNAYIDCVRALPGCQRRREAAARNLRVLRHGRLDEDRIAAGGLELTATVEVRRILELLSEESFPPRQQTAISLWLRGHDHAEIAEMMGLGDSKSAARLLHAARERLRRRVMRGAVRSTR